MRKLLIFAIVEDMPENNWKRYFPVIIVVIIIWLGWMSVTSFFKAAIITVSGVGEVSVAPAKVSLVFTRIDSAADAALAIDANKSATDKLVAFAKNFGGQGTEIKRSNYQVTPQNNQYVVVTGVTVKTPSYKSINDMVKELYRSGATTVSNLTYESADRVASEQLARKVAVKNAKIQAEKLASAGGKRLGRLVSMLDDDSVNSEGTVADVSKQDTVDQMMVSKKVQMVYEIW